MDSRAFLLLAASVFAGTPASWAQCGYWANGWGNPMVNGTIYASTVFTGMYGQCLYVGLDALDSGFGFAGSDVVFWDGRVWNAQGYLNGPVRALAAYDSGSGPKLYAGGDFTTTSSGPMTHIARMNGLGWAAVGGGINGRVDALAAFDDGSGVALYAAGSFTTAGGVPVQNLARWNGSSWSTAGLGIDGEVRALAVFDPGTGPVLVAAGDFTHADGVPASHVAEWNGTSWSALSSGVDGSVRALRTYRVGATELLAVGGDFTHAGALDASRVASWDGASWSALGAGFDASVNALGKHDFGAGQELYAAGAFAGSGGVTTGAVARWDGAAWTPAGLELVGSVNTLASYASAQETSERLFAGGHFAIQPSVAGSLNVAAYDGTSWTVLARGLDGTVNRLLVHDDGTGSALYAGGTFADAGGVRVNNVGKWNGHSWSALGSGLTGAPGFGPAGVYTFAEHDDGTGNALYAGGQFDFAGVVAASSVAKWDGTGWSNLGTGVDGFVLGLASFDDGTGRKLYASGLFDHAGGVACVNVARWNGSSWAPVGEGIPGSVGDLAAFDDGTGPALYACVHGVVRWNGASWFQVGSVGDSISRLAVLDDGTGPALYAWGYDGIFRWNGAVWTTITSGTVEAVTAFDEGTGDGPRLFASGWDSVFKRVGTTWALSSRFESSGSSIPAYDMAVFDDGDGSGPDLYIGGIASSRIQMTIPAYAPMAGIAVLPGCGQTGKLFCFGDGTSTACPCGNASAVGERAGCLHSLGQGGAVRARGLSSITHDTLVLDGTQMTDSSALYVQGATLSNGGAGVVFGDGIKCANAPFWRLGTKTNVAGASSLPQAGDLALSVRGHVTSPGKRYYQIRYRNAAAFCTSDTFNYTNGVEILWSP